MSCMLDLLLPVFAADAVEMLLQMLWPLCCCRTALLLLHLWYLYGDCWCSVDAV
jgi:hypothetical protein